MHNTYLTTSGGWSLSSKPMRASLSLAEFQWIGCKIVRNGIIRIFAFFIVLQCTAQTNETKTYKLTWKSNHGRKYSHPNKQLFRKSSYLIFVIFFYTSIFQGLKILHSNVRKFATKIASRQNSVNQYWEVKFTFILCVELQTVCKITPCV